MTTTRRQVLGAGAAAWLTGAAGLASPGLSQAQAPSGHAHHGGGYERLNQPGLVPRPPQADQQAVFDSPVPKASNPGRWSVRAALPLPRSEMAWATVLRGRMHLVGGYGEQRVDRAYHHVYDPEANRWIIASPLPLGANHVGVATMDARLYAIGGFVEQNRKPHAECFTYTEDGDRWQRIAPLPAACGSVACVALNGVLHGIGGAVGDTFATKKSVDWHLAYDPQADRWERRAPLPTGRDHVAALPHGGLIHVIGGRVDSFLTNSSSLKNPFFTRPLQV